MQQHSEDDLDSLGGRLPLLTPEELNDAQRAVYQGISEGVMAEAAESGFTARLEDGRFIGPFNAMLRIPAITAGFGQWTGQIAQSGMADDVRQIVILTVGAAWSAAYEIDAHRSAARAIGIPDTAIDAVLAGEEPHGLSAAALVAHRLTDALLADHTVPDDLYDEVIALFGESGTIAILSLVGQYQTVSSILVTFQVPVPPARH